jgi:hypothetical protein
VSAADAGGRQPLGAEAMDICFEAWYGTHEGGTDHRHLALAAWRQGVALAATIASASLAAARAERDAARDALIHLRYCARQAPYMAPEQNPGELLRDALRRADAALAPRASEPAAGGGK